MANANDELVISLGRLSTYDALIKNYIGYEIPKQTVTYTEMVDEDGNIVESPDIPVLNLNNIDDSTIRTDKSWSSQKVSQLLQSANSSLTTSSGTVISRNADYAEVGEWVDGNPDGEDRIGYFVAVDDTTPGVTMVKANSSSDVRGVTVKNPAFSGGCASRKFDPTSGELLPRYNYVAVMGLVAVIDNGTCEINGRCMPSDDGTAIPSSNNMGYQVIDRISDNQIIIAIEPSADMVQRIKTDIVSIKEQLQNVNTNFVLETNKGLEQKFWRGTQEEFDALESKSSDTMYIVTDERGVIGGDVGDMKSNVYDPTGKETDIFAYVDEHSANIPITSTPGDDVKIWINPDEDDSNDGYYTKEETDELMGSKLNATDIADWAKAANKPSYSADEVGAIARRGYGYYTGNIDELITAGCYLCINATGTLPTNNEWVTMFVMAGGTGSFIQIASGALTGGLWVRHHEGNGWMPWQRMMSINCWQPETDFNALIENGIYQCQGVNLNTPYGSDTDTHFHVIVDHHNPIWIRQTALDVRTQNMYTRGKFNGEWSAWQQIMLASDMASQNVNYATYSALSNYDADYVARLRNQALVATDTTPGANGQIFWTYG